MPDGLILCEAKVPPAGLPQAMGQVSEYRRSVGATEKVKGVFALVYANKLRKDFEVYYSSEISTDLQRFKTLEELAKYILEKTQEKEVRVTPISTQKIIHILDESVGLLSVSLLKTSTQELEGVLRGRDFFSTVLDYEQESHISDIALKSAAAYSARCSSYSLLPPIPSPESFSASFRRD